MKSGNLISIGIFIIFMTVCAFQAEAQGAITGNSTPGAGNSYFYQVVDDAVYSNPGFSIDNGSVVPATVTGTGPFTYKASLTFYGPLGTQTVYFWANGSILFNYPVSVVCPNVTAPGVTFSYTNQCGSTTISYTGSPTVDTWFWQTSPTGTDTSQPNSSFVVTAPGTYYLRAQRNAAQGCWSPATSTASVTIWQVPSNPVVGTYAVVCSGTLTATPGANANTVRWYTASTGGSPISQLTTCPAPASSTTYYISSYNTTTLCESSRIPMGVVVTMPSAPTPGVTSVLCSGTLTATPGANGDQVKWYVSAGAPTAFNVGNTSPAPGSSTTYYLSTYNTTKLCESARIPVNITVTYPGVPSVSSSVSVLCSGTLTGSVGTNGDNLRWYSVASGGTPIVTSMTCPAPASTTTYYVSTYNTALNCESARVAMTITVGFPGPPTIPTTNICGSGTISAIPGSNGTAISWYSAASGGTALSTNKISPYTTATTTYYVVTRNTTLNCETTPRLPVTVVVNPLPVITSSSSPALTYGAPGTFPTLTANAGFTAYQWQKNGQNISGATLLSLNTDGPGNYTVVTTASGTGQVCSSSVAVTNITDQPLNLVSTSRILKEGVTTGTSLFSLNPQDIAQSVTYQDGIGRTYQSVAIGISPQKNDMVNPVAYGKQGLIDTTFLPYVTSGRDGRFRQLAVRNGTQGYAGSEQYLYYQNSTIAIATDTKPFARTIHRASPDARVIEQGAPGADWQPGAHTIKNTLTVDSVTVPVKYWDKTGNSSQNYPAGKLMQSITIDENGNKVRSFTNKLGQVILKKVQVDQTNYLQTYYVYDQFGRLTYQIPPKAVAAIGSTSPFNVASNALTDELVYKYTYDSLGRVIEKKVPGAAVEYIVYDRLGRVVLTQDGNLRPYKKWQFIKYDSLNRPVYAGTYQNTLQTTRKGVQLLVRNIDYSTARYAENKVLGGAIHGYTNLAFPTSNITVMTVNYYDNYDFDNNHHADYKYDSLHFSGQEATSLRNVRGLATGSKRVIMDSTGNVTSKWLLNVVFYGKYDRPIQVQSNNHLLSALTPKLSDKKTIIYDFTKALKSKLTHRKSATDSLVYVDRSDYDHAGRPLRLYRRINADQEVLLVEYVYNQIGQVIEKNLHCTNCGDPAQAQPTTVTGASITRNTFNSSEQAILATQSITLSPGFYATSGSIFNARIITPTATEPVAGGQFLQSIDYRYNIRGWLSSINNSQLTNDGQVNNDTNDYFGMELFYNKAETSSLGNSLYYNGNISAAKWKGPGPSGAADQRSYKYSYDRSDRLLSATFQAMSSTPAWNKEVNTLNETMTYDVNGNILTLNRNQNQRSISGISLTNAPQAIDQLTYTYDASNPNRLTIVEDAVSGSVGDLGFKNVVNVGGTPEYTYNSVGSLRTDKNKGIDSIQYSLLGKVQRVYFTDHRRIDYVYDAAGNKLAVRNYGVNGSLQSSSDYIGGFVYENHSLSFFSSPEGRVKATGTNMITNGDCSTLSGFTIYNSTSAQISNVTLNGQTYLKIVSNQNGGNGGVNPMGGTFTVQPGERYSFRIKGYRTTADGMAMIIATNSALVSWPGPLMPIGASKEDWIVYNFTIPAGSTQLTVGLLWSNSHLIGTGQEAYIDKVELVKLAPEYQYVITDHQGNNRVLFTSATQTPQVVTANFEAATNSNFQNYPTGGSRNSFTLYNHTAGGTYSNLLTGGNNSQVGVAKSYKVYPGDKVKIEAWAKYDDPGSNPASSNIAGFASALLGAFGVAPPANGEMGTLSSGINSYGGWVAGGSGPSPTGPRAFVNILVYDKNYVLLDMPYAQVDPNAKQVGATPVIPHSQVSQEYVVQEEGYVLMFVSNESPTLVNVYFDDVKMTYTPSNVLQYNEYYPFGLQTTRSWSRDNVSNNFLANGGTELNPNSVLYDLEFRNYDPQLGRMNQVDPLAGKYSSSTPYNYAFNSPTTMNDPRGDESRFSGKAYCSWCDRGNGNAGGFDPWLGNIKDNGTAGGGPSGGGSGISYDGHGEWTIDFNRMGANGGTWNNQNGYHDFLSQEEGLVYGIAYNNAHNSWANTEYKSEAATVFAYLWSKSTGSSPSRATVDYWLDRQRQIISGGRRQLFASLNGGASGKVDLLGILKENRFLALRIALHMPDAIAYAGNINMVIGFAGTDIIYFGKEGASNLTMITGPDSGMSKPFWEIPFAIGWDLSIGVAKSEFYFVRTMGSDPLKIGDFEGFRISVNAGFGWAGFDGGTGITYSKIAGKGFYIGINSFIGVGDPGPSLNVNWGNTYFDRR